MSPKMMRAYAVYLVFLAVVMQAVYTWTRGPDFYIIGNGLVMAAFTLFAYSKPFKFQGEQDDI